MANSEAKKPIPQLRMRQNELDELFALYAALHEIEKAKSDMRARLKAIPNGYRDLRLVEVTLTRLTDDLIKTIPIEKLKSIYRMLPRMKYKVYFNGAVSEMRDNATAIDAKDLKTLCRLVHESYCFLCDSNCNTCKYGINKVFERILDIDREDGERWSGLRFDE